MVISWSIVNMEYIVQNGFVVIVDWNCIATEGTESKYVYGQQNFPYNPEQPGFIPYDQLTELDVIGWVKDQLGEERVLELETTAQSELQRVITPSVASGIPWQNNIPAAIIQSNEVL